MKPQSEHPLFAEERKGQILELLRQKSKLLVPELCDYFDVSPATIRNDLRDLENERKLIENPRWLKTPVVRNGRQATVGYQPEVWKAWK